MDLKRPVYVVKSGRSKGVFDSKEEAVKLTRGYPNPVYERITNVSSLLRYCEDTPDLYTPLLEYCKTNGISVKMDKSKGVTKFSVYQPTVDRKVSNNTTSPRAFQTPLAVDTTGNYSNISFEDSSQSSITEDDDLMAEDTLTSFEVAEKEATATGIEVYISSSQETDKHGKESYAISVSCYNNYRNSLHPFAFISERLPLDQAQTREVADLYSLIKALEILPLDRNLKVHTASSYLTSVARNAHTYKVEGWPTHVPHMFMIRYLSFLWDRRQGLTEIHRSSTFMSKKEAQLNMKSATEALKTPASKTLLLRLAVPENY
jgi:hypothetical protein